MTIDSITLEYRVTAVPAISPSALQTALSAVPLPTGPTGDMSQVTQATLTSDTPGLIGAVASRTLVLSWPDTTVAASLLQSGPIATDSLQPVGAGAHAVTPESMANIVAGSVLGIDAGQPTLAESVIVTGVTATTFTASFVNAHAAKFSITGNGAQVVTPASMANIFGAVSTTSPGAVAAGSHVVTPASMTNIVVGAPLVIADVNLLGQPDPTLQETVVVSAVSPTTFTATFANPHGLGFSIVRTASDLQVDFKAFGTTVAAAVAAGTQFATPVAMGPIAVGMVLTIDSGLPSQENVEVIAATATSFQAKFLFAHAPGFAVITGNSIPGTNPENVTVLVVTATTFIANFQFAHTAPWKVGGIVNAMFPGTPSSSGLNGGLASAFRGLYQPLLANRLMTKVVAIDPVVAFS